MAMLQRLDFNSLKKKYTKNGKSKVRLTESSLILIQNITANKTVYNFPVLENEGAAALINPQEIRLNINDEFIVNKVGIYLIASITDGGLPIQFTKLWLPYVPIEMSAAQFVNENLYDGFMRMSVNNINFIDKWDIKKHQAREQTQIKNFSAGIPNTTLPEARYKETGMVEMTPNVTLSGAKKNEVALVLPNSLAVTAAIPIVTVSGTLQMTVNQIGIVYRGFLAQNASAFQG